MTTQVGDSRSGGIRAFEVSKQNLDLQGYGYSRFQQQYRWMPTPTPEGKSNAGSYRTLKGDISFGDLISPEKPPAVFDVPSAAPRQKKHAADIEFDKKKRLLAHRLPILNIQQIARFRLPHRKIVINKLTELGYNDIVKELAYVIKDEDILAERLHKSGIQYSKITEDKQFEEIADGLRLAADFVNQHEFLMAIGIRKTIAETMLKTADKKWLATHLYETCLDLADEVLACGQDQIAFKLQSEIKCILGYIKMNDCEGQHLSDFAMQKAIQCIEESRFMSKDKDWIMELLGQNALLVKLKTPVALIGLRDEYEIIDGHSVSLHSLATLLLYEMFHLRAIAIIYSKRPEDHTYERLSAALRHARKAFQFAFEIHDNVAVNSAYMVLGEIYRKMGYFNRATRKFEDLLQHADLQQDWETEAVAYNLIGQCFAGLKDPVNALENFVCQKEVAEQNNLFELELHALEHIGQCLLEEGCTVEAELCFMEAFYGFQTLKSTVPDFALIADSGWMNLGISAGINLWGRFAGYCRMAIVNHKYLEDLCSWKNVRSSLCPLKHPHPVIPTPLDFVPGYEQVGYKVPAQDTENNLQIITEVFKKYPRETMLAESFERHVPRVSAGIPSLSSVQVLLEARDKKRKAAAVSSVDSTNLELHKEVSGNILTWQDLMDDGYDEGEPTIYESDLNSWTKKSGNFYWLGKTKYKIITRKTFDNNRKRRISIIKTSKPGSNSNYYKSLVQDSKRSILYLPGKRLRQSFFKTPTTVPKTLQLFLVTEDTEPSSCTFNDRDAYMTASDFERFTGDKDKSLDWKGPNRSHHGGLSKLIQRASQGFKSVLIQKRNLQDEHGKSFSQMTANALPLNQHAGTPQTLNEASFN